MLVELAVAELRGDLIDPAAVVEVVAQVQQIARRRTRRRSPPAPRRLTCATKPPITTHSPAAGQFDRHRGHLLRGDRGRRSVPPGRVHRDRDVAQVGHRQPRHHGAGLGRLEYLGGHARQQRRDGVVAIVAARAAGTARSAPPAGGTGARPARTARRRSAHAAAQVGARQAGRGSRARRVGVEHRARAATSASASLRSPARAAHPNNALRTMPPPGERHVPHACARTPPRWRSAGAAARVRAVRPAGPARRRQGSDSRPAVGVPSTRASREPWAASSPRGPPHLVAGTRTPAPYPARTGRLGRSRCGFGGNRLLTSQTFEGTPGYATLGTVTDR